MAPLIQFGTDSFPSKGMTTRGGWLNCTWITWARDVAKLLPWRPSRKFQQQQAMEDPSKELKAAKAERAARFNAANVEPAKDNSQELAELKKKRQQEMRAAEEK